MRPFVKASVFFGSVVGVLVLACMLSIFKISTAMTYRIFDVHATPVARRDDPASRERGAHLVNTVLGCTDCHGQKMGGRLLIDDGSIGIIAAPNLTRGQGGRPASFQDIDFVRAIRHGVDPIDRGLWLMPTRAYASLSDADLGCVLGDLASRDTVNASWPSPSITWRGRTKVAFRQLKLLQVTDEPLPTTPTADPGPTTAYGAYLARIANCIGCHNEGPSTLGNGEPAGAMRMQGWTQADFVRAMRQGVRPDGTPIRETMPWPRFKDLTDTELTALWQALSG